MTKTRKKDYRKNSMNLTDVKDIVGRLLFETGASDFVDSLSGIGIPLSFENVNFL